LVNNELIKLDEWMWLNKLSTLDEWMCLNKLSILYTKSMYFLLGNSINKAEEEKKCSKLSLIMLCYIGKHV